MTKLRNTHAVGDKMSRLDRLVERLGEQTVTVRQNGQAVEMPTTEAVLLKQIATAISGSPHAQRQYLESVRFAEEARAKQVAAENESWRSIRRHHLRAYADHREVFGTDPELFPHPDDIEIVEGRPVRVLGPINKAEFDAVRRILCQIMALLHQDALNRARAGRRKYPASIPGDCYSIAVLLNEMVPRRLGRSDDYIIARRMELSGQSVRELLKGTRAAWSAAGHDVARGGRAPSSEEMLLAARMAAALSRYASDPSISVGDADRVAAVALKDAVANS